MKREQKYIDSMLIQEHLTTLRWKVNYWETRYDRECHGERGSQNSHVNFAKEELQKYDRTIEDIPAGDLSLCIRSVMRKLYREAEDFCFNPLICVRNLRRVITLRERLNKLNPEYTIYSTKFLMNVK